MLESICQLADQVIGKGRIGVEAPGIGQKESSDEIRKRPMNSLRITWAPVIRT
jgi:hypothetical protein